MAVIIEIDPPGGDARDEGAVLDYGAAGRLIWNRPRRLCARQGVGG